MINIDTRKLQTALELLGYDTRGIDGIFGIGTRTAVMQFQRDNKLVVDGIVGSITINKLNQLLDNPVAETKSKYYKKGNVSIIETHMNNVDMKIVGNTLVRGKVYGVNANFFNTGKPALPESCWGIATSNGKPIGGNSMLVSYSPSVKRGTIIGYRDGTVGIEIINNINEIRKPHIWAVSGHSVFPSFIPSQITRDINYRTAHTYIGFKGSTVYMFVKPSHMISEIIPFVKSMKLDGCIVVDGGGSSQLRHPSGSFASSRKINSAMILKEV